MMVLSLLRGKKQEAFYNSYLAAKPAVHDVFQERMHARVGRCERTVERRRAGRLTTSFSLRNKVLKDRLGKI